VGNVTRAIGLARCAAERFAKHLPASQRQVCSSARPHWVVLSTLERRTSVLPHCCMLHIVAALNMRHARCAMPHARLYCVSRGCSVHSSYDARRLLASGPCKHAVRSPAAARLGVPLERVAICAQAARGRGAQLREARRPAGRAGPPARSAPEQS
jgi:hypothetical protein